ncbi:MAG: aminotransferase class III-fold pyridoxal phosphate-dependent enzyme [Burkholderiales bacterium]|nr:aminotransferase class III-fold pyridoxal phosphate-dependent enzyme [Burkholderiales bacterium]
MGHSEPQLEQQARDPFWMPFSPNREFKQEPRLFVRAQGMYCYTPDGQEVIDASAGLFCVAAGHCRPEIAQAVFDQLNSLDFVAPFLRAHPKSFELAQRVIDYTPEGLNRVRRAFGTGLAGVYHMRHTALPENRFVCGQPEHGAELADDLQRFCQLYGGENIAAVFVEPTAGSFGCLPPPRGYLDRLRAICDAHGILLVFDEVITGWGRMGANFGAQAFGVTPDIMTMAKALTNGAQPMGAVAARQGIYDTITEAGPERGVEFFHGYTYSAHPAACAAALAMMDIFRDEKLIDRAAQMSPYFLESIFAMKDLPIVTDIRGVGMMAAIDVAPGATPGARGHEAQKRLYDAGLNLKSTGDALIIAPPFVAERHHIDEIAGKLRAVLATL